MSPLERQRKAAGLTQAELADLINATPSNVAQWERGEKQPHPSLYPKLAEALGITPIEATRLIVPEGHPGEPSTTSAA